MILLACSRSHTKKFTAINRRLDTAKISTQQAHNLVDQRLQQQRKQIRLLSSTSRDDWRLAEAEYLLRLAGQRLLMERGAVGALALMQAADRILFELDDLDLFSVREQLARDMTALKLIASVDQSGIYLQLGSLSEQVDKLPLLPNQLDESDTTDVALIKVEPAVDEASNWEKIKSNFVRTFSTVGDYIQVRTHDKAPETLLPIDGGLYLQQNIRFSIERAQLALLREEQAIYSDALQQAADLIQRYYAMQPAAKFIAEELRALAQVNVDVTLPSINASLLALQDYTSKLHKLNAEPSPLPNTDAAAKSSLDTEE
jgi:uroporphyrin-3 C-methyltransferase